MLTVQQGGSAVISDIDVKAQSEYHWGNYAFYNYGSLTVNNVDFTVSSSYQEQGQGGNSAYGIYTFNAESLVVDGCTFSVDGAYTGNTGNSAYGVYVRDTENVEIKNCDITVTGQGGSVYGIYLFSGDIDLISNVKIDSGGTGIYTKNPINRIESSVIKGSDYSLRIFSPGYANVTRDTEFIGTASTDYINYVD